MKKIVTFLFSIALLHLTADAKKVKFSVDMTGIIVLSTGVHVAGDFQTLAGFAGGDFNASTTQMFQEPFDTNIYSVIVDIPAFAKYEYRFFNGDQSYETEFIPALSQIGYNFNDNRWIYVDSTANDTTFIGAIPFSGTAPAGKKLLRILVDLQNQSSVNANGVHVSGAFNNYSLEDESMYSFIPNVYEKIIYVDAGINEYKFYNGNTIADEEIVPASCASNGYRTINMVNDTLLAVVCFSSCDACVPSAARNDLLKEEITVFPNPVSTDQSFRILNAKQNSIIKIYQSNGSLVKIIDRILPGKIEVSASDLNSGVYFVQIISANNMSTLKICVE
jgi:hypothetical protein